VRRGGLGLGGRVGGGGWGGVGGGVVGGGGGGGFAGGGGEGGGVGAGGGRRGGGWGVGGNHQKKKTQTRESVAGHAGAEPGVHCTPAWDGEIGQAQPPAA